MYVGAASHHVLRMSFVPEQEAQNFDMQVTTFWSHLIQRDIASPLFFFTSQTRKTWSGLCSSATCSGPMARLAVDHHHVNGNLMHPSSEAYEAEDRCLRNCCSQEIDVATSCNFQPCRCGTVLLQQSAAGLICNKTLDPQEHHGNGCRYGGGVDRRHAAVARCPADVIHSHSGTKVFIEQEVPALRRVVNGQTEHARMDLVFNLTGSVTYLDVSIVAPFSCSPSLVSAASTRPGHMAKRAEENKFVRFHTSTSSLQAGLDHTPENFSNLMRDAVNPPLAIAIQSELYSAISKQQLIAALT